VLHGTTSEMKYNYFSGQNNFISFQTWFSATLKFFEIILF